MNRRAALTAGMIAMSVSLLAATSAHADASVVPGKGLDKCPKGYFCLYQHFTYNLNDARGLILKTSEDISRLDDFDFNDRASSYYNNTDHFVTVYEHFFQGGDAQQFAPGDHGDLSGWWNDTVSSVKIG